MNEDYGFNKTPLAPPGTKAIVNEDPNNRGPWSPHGKIVWYVGPARGNYRCYKVLLPAYQESTHRETCSFFINTLHRLRNNKKKYNQHTYNGLSMRQTSI